MNTENLDSEYLPNVDLRSAFFVFVVVILSIFKVSAEDINIVGRTGAIQSAISRSSDSCESDTIKLLMIGNSFATAITDEVSHLQALLKHEGVKFIIGRLHIPSCSLKMHLDNATSDAHVYQFRAWDNDGIKYKDNSAGIKDALLCERWTHVSFQQVSNLSGIESSYGSTLRDLIAYVENYICHDTQKLFHQTWAYAPTFTGGAFSSYGYNQLTMFNAIVSVAMKITTEYDIDRLIPAGTAIQNARSTSLGDNLTTDGMHPDNVGMYVACLAWCESLTGHDSRDSGYRPANISEDDCVLAREAAHAAIISPFAKIHDQDNDNMTIGIYDLAGRKIDVANRRLPRGIYIISRINGTSKVLR